MSKTYKIKRTDFRFEPTGQGQYYVTYQSSSTGKKWSATIDCMPLIDLTRNCDEPKQKHLKELISLIKNKMK